MGEVISQLLFFGRRKKKCAGLRPPGFIMLDEDEDDEDCCEEAFDPMHRSNPLSILQLTSSLNSRKNSASSTITSSAMSRGHAI